MKSMHVLKAVVVASVCALALVVAVGCSSASSSSASSASGSASSASAASAAASSAASSPASSAASSSAASSAAASSAASSAASAGQMTEQDAIAQGYQVFKGTVRVCTAEELITLQAIDIDPAVAGGGGTYAVLEFDQETNVTGESADGSGQRTESAYMLGIAEHTDYSSFVIEYGDLDKCKSLDGQHVTMAAKAGDIVFPSDVSLPIGQPKAQVSVFLS